MGPAPRRRVRRGPSLGPGSIRGLWKVHPGTWVDPKSLLGSRSWGSWSLAHVGISGAHPCALKIRGFPPPDPRHRPAVAEASRPGAGRRHRHDLVCAHDRAPGHARTHRGAALLARALTEEAALATNDLGDLRGGCANVPPVWPALRHAAPLRDVLKFP